MLGDGSLTDHAVHPNLFIKHKEAHRELVEWKYDVFSNLTSMPINGFDQALNGNKYPALQFATRATPALAKWRRLFYPYGVKVVPASISTVS